MTTTEHVRVGVRHPLDPLTAEEIETVSRILTRDRGLAASARFVHVTLAMCRRGVTDFDMVMVDPWWGRLQRPRGRRRKGPLTSSWRSLAR